MVSVLLPTPWLIRNPELAHKDRADLLQRHLPRAVMDRPTDRAILDRPAQAELLRRMPSVDEEKLGIRNTDGHFLTQFE